MQAVFRILVLVVALLMSVGCLADVLVLKNGDRITGEIKQIWDAEVVIEPSYSDEFTVDMDVIVAIESEREFEITLANGREVVARPAGVDGAGKQQLIVADETVLIEVETLTELDEIDEYFDWELNADWSAAANSGNTDSVNNRLAANSTVRFGDHRHIGELVFVREEQNRVPTKEQDVFSYNYNWLFRDPWFLSGAYSFERDPIRELDNRSILSAGLGRDIFNTPRLALNFQLGAGFITERIGGGSEDSTVVNWRMRYRQDVFNEDLEIFHNNSIVAYVDGRENTIYRTSTGLRYEITDLLYANIQVDYDYETQVVDTASNEDISILFGLGLEL